MKHYSTSWSRAAGELAAAGKAYALITLLGVRGSTPRDTGSKMVITADATYDTIGGGHLEFKATTLATELLEKGEITQHIEHFSLGPNLGQCCGGSTTVLFEVFPAVGTPLMVFGAGHVAQALMPILSQLPCQIRWVDNREDFFPESTAQNIETLFSEHPKDEIRDMPTNSYYLVMTHNHQLDFEICETILKRDDFAYLGLIASKTKWRRFQQRFDYKGIPQECVERMACPVGLSSVPGKLPMEVAVSIAGEIIQTYQQNKPSQPTQQGMHWRDIKQLLVADLVTPSNKTPSSVK
jgi:xanthine dehydrogenase accessory factor